MNRASRLLVVLIERFYPPTGKNRAFYQDHEPKFRIFARRNRLQKGDIWFDTSNRHAIHVFDGVTWYKLKESNASTTKNP